MLAVSPLRNPNNDEKQGEMASFPMGGEGLPDFSDGNLLDSIDFDDLFTGINDGHVLPDLEMDPEIIADFSTESEVTAAMPVEKVENPDKEDEEEREKGNVSGSDSGATSNPATRKETVRKLEESVPTNPPPKEADQKGRKPSSQCKTSQGKRKVKVDWTPELHRRFVQAVEQLGVDKAVPSRILELMGIDCLTRHNIASHLQKYRSHRKHLLAREAEAASWNQRRQMYGAAVGDGKRGMSPWVAPTMGFPPMTPPMHHFRPLHVWGHPTVDQSLVPIWPKHLAHSPSPPPPAAAVWPPAAAPPHPPPSHPDPSYWHPPHQCIPSAVTPGTPCFPQPLTPTRFPTLPVPAVPPHAFYKVETGVGVPPGQPGPRPPFDFQPSKESIDAAIGDVLSKPWLPLPLGLKPPSIDSVLGELQRQGIPKVPPSCA